MDDVDADIYVLQICCTRWNDMCLSYKLNGSSVFLGILSTDLDILINWDRKLLSSSVLVIFRVASDLSGNGCACKTSLATSSQAFLGLTFRLICRYAYAHFK